MKPVPTKGTRPRTKFINNITNINNLPTDYYNDYRVPQSIIEKRRSMRNFLINDKVVKKDNVNPFTQQNNSNKKIYFLYQELQNYMFVEENGMLFVYIRINNSWCHIRTCEQTPEPNKAYKPDAPTDLVATAGDRSASISFIEGNDNGYPIINYLYSINGGATFTAFVPPQFESPVLITGLKNGVTYSVALKAVNMNGASKSSSTVSVTPDIVVTDAPTNLVAITGDQSVTISFTQTINSNIPITNYQYSLNGGTTFIAFDPAQNHSPVFISGLVNGVTYPIVLRAVNILRTGNPSSTIYVTTSTVPSAPAYLTAQAGNESATISFIQYSNGGAAILNYQYSLDGGVTFTLFNPSQSKSPVIITGLTNNVTYYVALKAVNINGASASSSVVTVTPSAQVPSAPINLVGTAGTTTISVSFTQITDGGSAITNYEYSLNGGTTFTQFNPSQTSSPVLISGLTSGVTYAIALKAINSVGTSSSSSVINVTTLSLPSAPTNVTAQSLNQSTLVSFTQESSGGSPIINYAYSLNGGQIFINFVPPKTSSPVLITGLTNGLTYYICLKAITSIGSSPSSSPPVSVVPSAQPPSPPTNLAGTLSTTSISLSFTQVDDGGSPITNYLYSINGGPFNSSQQRFSPIFIQGLTSGQTYNIALQAVNAVGTSSSSFIQLTTLSIPSAPSNLIADNGNQIVSIRFVQSSTGGVPIINYLYSINGGITYLAFVPPQIRSPVIVSGLTNGQQYSIYLIAVNSIGYSLPSTYVTGNPTSTVPTIPSQPINLLGTPYNSYVEILFTQSSNGGSTITNYAYTFDSGYTFQPFNPSQISAPVRISGLSNGTGYNISLVAKNNYGLSPLSYPLLTITPTSLPPTVPSAPTFNPAINSVVNSSQQSIIYFTQSSNGGSPITNYYYCTNGDQANPTFIPFNPAQIRSPVTITQQSTGGTLTNGTIYTVFLIAVNSIGSSQKSSSILINPTSTLATVPPAPLIISIIADTTSVTVYFTQSGNGGSVITNYQYSVNANSGTPYFQAFNPIQPGTQSGSNFYVIIGGLVSGQTYSIAIKAVNSVGVSTASSSQTTTTLSSIPLPPVIISLSATNNNINIAFTQAINNSPQITNYQYSIDSGQTFISFNPAQIGPTQLTITSGLTGGSTYYVAIKAINSVGISLSSNIVPVTILSVPSAPVITNGTPNDSFVTVSFTPPTNIGGTPITSYKYSYNGYVGPFITSPTLTSPITIPGLTNGTTYQIAITAINAVGTSPPSNIISLTPIQQATVPSSPVITGSSVGSGTVTILFTQGNDGGSVITNYYYSTGGSYIVVSSFTSSSAIINGLTNGTTYTIRLIATNSVGSSTASNSITVTPVSNSNVPSAPTNLAGTSGNSSAIVSYTAPTGYNGPAVTSYGYTTTGINGPFTIFSVGTNPVTVTGLTNGVQANIQLVAYNSVGQGALSNILYITPTPTVTVPSAPTDLALYSVTANSARISFTQNSNGGSAITSYNAYINGSGSPTSLPYQTSPVTLAGLTSGIVYNITLQAVNSVGNSPLSSIFTFSTLGVPTPPTNLVGNPSSTTIGVSFTQGYNGGTIIYTYNYSTTADGTINFVQFSNPYQANSPVTITRDSYGSTLQSNTTYSILLQAVNSIGASSNSSEIIITTLSGGATVPPPPTNLYPSCQLNQFLIYFVQTSTGGSPITSYNYTTDGGITYASALNTSNIPYTTSPILIFKTSSGSQLENGVTYNVTLQAVNSIGHSINSTTITATPSDPATQPLPPAPTNLVATPGNNSVSISFSQQSGYNVTNYQYTPVINGLIGTSIVLDPLQPTSPIIITGLINGTTYTVYLKAINSYGLGLSSTGVTFTPGQTSTVPDPPTNLVGTPGNQQAIINFIPGSNGGSPITNYSYCTNSSGIPFKPFTPATGAVSSVTITTTSDSINPLQNGTTYPITLKAINANGSSIASSTIYVTPAQGGTAPSQPTNLYSISSNQSVSVYFVLSSNGGSPITSYSYSTDNGTTYRSLVQTGNPIQITVESNTGNPLTNGINYNFTFYAINSYGNGSTSSNYVIQSSATPSVPPAPTNLLAVPGNGDVVIYFSEQSGYNVFNYAYSKSGQAIIAYDPYLPLSPATITGLTNGQSYTFYLCAINVYGPSPNSATVTVTPNLFPTVAVGTGTNSIAYSYVGSSTWTGLGSSTFTQGNGVAYNGSNLWVAVGSGTYQIASSSTGTSWTGGTTGILTAGYGVAYNGSNLWVVVGSGTNSILYSTTGTGLWLYLGSIFFTTAGYGVAYGSNLWVAVGSGTNSIAYSSNPTSSWTGIGTSIFSTSGNGVAYNGSNLWVAVGQGTNSIAYSSNGTSWTGIGTTIFTIGYGVAYYSNLWVAVGQGTNSIAYSSNGTSWTGVTNSTNIFTIGRGVVYNGRCWVAVGVGPNTIAYSYDGISWAGEGNTIFTMQGFGVA
jgi:titin